MQCIHHSKFFQQSMRLVYLSNGLTIGDSVKEENHKKLFMQLVIGIGLACNKLCNIQAGL